MHHKNNSSVAVKPFKGNNPNSNHFFNVQTEQLWALGNLNALVGVLFDFDIMPLTASRPPPLKPKVTSRLEILPLILRNIISY